MALAPTIAPTSSASGVVLYEMVSGVSPFRRETAAETMTAILREQPPEICQRRWPARQRFARLLRHCLEKEPAERFQSARDLVFNLEAASDATPLPAA